MRRTLHPTLLAAGVRLAGAASAAAWYGPRSLLSSPGLSAARGRAQAPAQRAGRDLSEIERRVPRVRVAAGRDRIEPPP